MINRKEIYKSRIIIGLNIIIVWLLQIMIVQGSEFPINAKVQLNKTVYKESKASPIDSAHIPKKDSVYDSYGNLLNEDIVYYPKFPLWIPIAEIVECNLCQNLLDDYLFRLPFNRVGFKSWSQNLKSGFPWNKGWWWDENRFGINFLYNPINGSTYYNIARTNGYHFWESIPFVVGGAYMWKIFGGTEKPERADLINSTTDGIFLGDIMYRVSSNILDDRTTGVERVGREFLAFLVDPTRGMNRIFHAQTWRITHKEVFEKEPLSVSLSSGIRFANNGVNFGSGPANPIFNARFDYGNPFDNRDWKPFDIFKFRAEFNFGVGRKIIDNLIGYGILNGTNRQYGNLEVLYGLFLNYDYWDNKVFELGTSAITAGIMTRWNLSDKSNLYTKLHLGFVPLAGNSALLSPDTSQYRDYDFGTGMERSEERRV